MADLDDTPSFVAGTRGVEIIPALAPRADRAYFAITLSGPCAQALRDSHEFGVYVPDALPDAELELAVLVNG